MAGFREELAWAGGFFEGEGCISGPANPAHGHALRVCLSNTDLPALQRFHAAIGGLGKVYGPYRRKDNPRAKPYWNWACQKFEPAQAVVAYLWPFLCQRRHERAVAVMRAAQEWRTK